MGCSSCGDDTGGGGDNNNNGDNSTGGPNGGTGGPNGGTGGPNGGTGGPNGTTGGPSEQCEEGDVWGEFGGAIAEDTTFCGTIAVTQPILTQGSVDVVIRPGTRFVFPQDSGFNFGGASFGGSEVVVTADGTEDEPIVFEGTQDVKGHWAGLTIGAGVVPTSTFSNIIVRHAGGEGQFGIASGAAIQVANTRGLDLIDVSVEKSGGVGFSVAAWGAGTDGLRLVDSVGPIVSVDTPDAVNNLPVVDIEDVENAYIDVTMGSVDRDITFGDAGHPYRLGSVSFSGDTTTFEAGAVVEFGLGARVRVRNGVWSANGTESDPVIFRGSRADVGHWQGISVETASAASVFEHVEIRHAGADDYFPLFLDTTVALKNLTIGDSTMPALQLPPRSSAVFGEGSTNIVIENDSNDASIHVGLHVLSTIPTDSDWGSGGAYIRVGDDNQTSLPPGTIPALDVPYRIATRRIMLNNGTDVTIEEGAVFEMAVDTTWDLGVGTFRADGVTFVSASGAKDDWKGFTANGTAASSYIRNSTISGAGSPGYVLYFYEPFDFTGNTVENTTSPCLRIGGSDTFDYEGQNTLNCDGGAYH